MAKKFNITSMQTDQKAEAEGTWVDAGGGLKLKIARATKPEFVEAISKARPFGGIQMANMTEDEAQEITRRAVSKFILVGWEGMHDGNAADVVAYSDEKAYDYFVKYPDFFRMVWQHANNVELFRTKAAQEAMGK